MTLVHRSPLGDVTVPSPSGVVLSAVAGEPVDVPRELAGKAPGPWAKCPDGHVVNYDDGVYEYRIVDGVTERRTPGVGLLANPDWSEHKAKAAEEGKH